MATTALHWMTHPPAHFTGGAVTIGNFDGVHRGHRQLLQAAKPLGSPVVAVTFSPSPMHLLAPQNIKPPIMSFPDRVEALHRAGADHVLVLETDPGLLSLSPEAFFEDVLLGLLKARAVVEGYNFRFGRAREGDIALLRRFCDEAKVQFAEVPPLMIDGEAVSSSRARTALLQADLVLVEKLLGRRHHVSGEVIPGAKRGRTIGIPTANLAPTEVLLPGDGVYAVFAEVDGVRFPAAANIGPNPTFGEQARKIEAHLLGFHGDIYGQTLQLEFVQRLRPTVSFPNAEALIAQLQQDIQAAKVACERSS
ncbi:MAG: riboflavin biosynthesis protein RibF [Fimbriiglobus sp.]